MVRGIQSFRAKLGRVLRTVMSHSISRSHQRALSLSLKILASALWLGDMGGEGIRKQHS